MNKGLEIRNNKLNKQAKKRNEIKSEQIGLCRFVSIKYQRIERINGKYRHLGEVKVNGLQVQNRVYLLDGKYKLINNKGVKITKIYNDIPSWSNELLINKYNKVLETPPK